jgi:hypothetical protein
MEKYSHNTPGTIFEPEDSPVSLSATTSAVSTTALDSDIVEDLTTVELDKYTDIPITPPSPPYGIPHLPPP